MAKDDKPESTKAKETGRIRRPVLRTGIMINPPPRTSLAAGYWGESPRDTVLSYQAIEQITRNNTDMLRGMGFVVDVWVQPIPLPFTPICSCVKQTNQAADVRCAKCHGLKYVPGYVKWGYNTMYQTAVDTLYGIPNTLVKNITTTQHTIGLASGVLSASLLTQTFSVNNPYLTGWDMQVFTYNRDVGNMVFTEWSIDNGNTWLTGDFKALELQAGNIQFKITLSRTNVNNLSPLFEVLRFRHPIQDEPYIRIARPMGRRKQNREVMGQVENESGNEYWTIPVKGSAQINGQVIWDKPWLTQEIGPNGGRYGPIMEVKEGSFAGDRFVPTDYQRSEHIGVMTSQRWTVRKCQTDEIYVTAVF